jgi:hypothetical protein
MTARVRSMRFFRADGGFIQHSHIPYTGGYGDVLFSGLAMLFPLVSGMRFDIVESARNMSMARAIEMPCMAADSLMREMDRPRTSSRIWPLSVQRTGNALPAGLRDEVRHRRIGS